MGATTGGDGGRFDLRARDTPLPCKRANSGRRGRRRQLRGLQFARRRAFRAGKLCGKRHFFGGASLTVARAGAQWRRVHYQLCCLLRHDNDKLTGVCAKRNHRQLGGGRGICVYAAGAKQRWLGGGCGGIRVFGAGGRAFRAGWLYGKRHCGRGKFVLERSGKRWRRVGYCGYVLSYGAVSQALPATARSTVISGLTPGGEYAIYLAGGKQRRRGR